jgi:hypothetical protein
VQNQAFMRGHGIPMLAVNEARDIEFLVKESEVLTGRAGRLFVIAGADWLTYRVLWHPMGFKVERLDEWTSAARSSGPSTSCPGSLLTTAWSRPCTRASCSPLRSAVLADRLFTPLAGLSRRGQVWPSLLEKHHADQGSNQ